MEVTALAADNAFWFKDTDAEAVWTSDVIDINAFPSAEISLTLLSSGNLESDNYARAYYVVDGGPEVALDNGEQTGSFFTAIASATVSGSTLQLVVRTFSDRDNEQHYIDDVQVNGIVDQATGQFTSGFTFYWFKDGDFTTPIFGAQHRNTARRGLPSR